MTNNYRLVLRLSSVLLLGGAGLGASGCSASVSVSADTCGADDTLGCSGTSEGFTCTGDVTPDTSSLVCSDGTDMADGSTGYCCIPITGTTSCSADATVTGCAYPSYGFSCTSSTDDPTSLDPTLNCSPGVADPDGSTDFCCQYGTTTTADTCTVDPTVTAACPDSSTTGYTCTGAAYPTDTDPTVTICSDPTTAGDAQTYCCASSTSTAFGCTNPDPNVTGCTGSSVGVSCLGGATPDSTTLICSIGETDPTTSTQEDYCCISLTTPEGSSSTCSPDETVNTCVYPSYGFSCASSTDDPTSLDPTLNCSAGVADPDGNTDFCCQ